MSGRAGRHDFGCQCRTHIDRPWTRSEHWTKAEVSYLEARFGHIADATIARKLGRSVLGIRLKAKRLGLRKRDAGNTARDVARIFGVDPTTVVDRWVAQGFLNARRAPWSQGPKPVYLTSDAALERFIAEHPEQIDLDKMPRSRFRDLVARDPWISLPEVHRRTGRNTFAVAVAIRYGILRGRRRGLRGRAHWYIPLADVVKIPPLKTADAIEESWFRRQNVLAARRCRRRAQVAS